MKKLLIALVLLLAFFGVAAADETEMMFRSIALMDKTGGVQDFAVRASIISGVRLKELDGVYSGKVKMGNARYTLIVRQEEGAAISVVFEAEDTASKWSTNGAAAKKFDNAMKELFGVPIQEVIRDENGQEKPLPRLTTGGLYIRRIGELRKTMYVEWRNLRGTIQATIEGRRDYRDCFYRLTLTFFNEPLTEAAPEEEPPVEALAEPEPEDDEAYVPYEGPEEEEEETEPMEVTDDDDDDDDEDYDDDFADDSFEEDEDSFIEDWDPEEDDTDEDDGEYEIDEDDEDLEGL